MSIFKKIDSSILFIFCVALAIFAVGLIILRPYFTPVSRIITVYNSATGLPMRYYEGNYRVTNKLGDYFILKNMNTGKEIFLKNCSIIVEDN